MSAFSGLDMMGFDRAANWQMVPEGGFRPIELMDGAGLDLNIVPAEGKTAISLKEGTSIPGFMSRSLTVMGLAPGNATITAATKTPDPRSHQVPGSGRSARLDVSVLPKGIQKLK